MPKNYFHRQEYIYIKKHVENENWFTLTFTNAFQQQKKALIKKTRSEIYPKSVYTSRDDRFDENSVSTSLKKLLPLAGISAKIQENGFNKQEYWSTLKIGLNLISWIVSTSG